MRHEDTYDALLRRFLDGELTGDEERDALHRLADDSEARALLRLDLGLRRLLGKGSKAAPADFTDRVMTRIEAASAGETREVAAADGTSGRLERLWRELRRPRTLAWRPANALLAAAACLLVVSTVIAVGGVAIRPGPSSALRPAGDAVPEEGPGAAVEGAERAAPAPGAGTVLVRFALEDASARSVAVAGDFSDWEPVPLVPRARDGASVWTGLVAVPRGEHRYMFVIDGSRWVTDPLATAHWDDGFGNRNAILSL